MDLKQVDLNLLVALDALLTERSVTRAGRRMGLSQPAMSAALARLRELFGDTLLERFGREHRLTPFARDLCAPLQTLLSSIERTLESNRAFDPGAERRFRIATSDYVMCLLLQPLYARIARIAPAVKLHVQPIDARVGSQLTSRRVDLTIQPPGMLTEFASQEIFEDEWVCAVCRNHPDVGDRLTREQFFALPHASFSLGQSSMLAHAIASPGDVLDVPLTCVNFAALPFVLPGTRMIAVIQRKLGERLRDAAAIRLLEVPFAMPKLKMLMWWNPSASDPAHAWLRGVIAEAAHSLQG